MNNAMQTVMSIPQWPFLQEPLYRWFLFLMALTAMSIAWNGVLSYI